MVVPSPVSSEYGPQTLGEMILLVRRRGDLTRERLAAVADVGVETLGRWERDETERIDLAGVRRVVKVLAVAASTSEDDLWQSVGQLVDAHTNAGSPYLEALAEAFEGGRD